MDRFLITVALAALISAGCGPAFKDRRTPSGDFCSDMPIIPAGQDVDREYHRLQPIQSDPKAHTEAERLESLRKVACSVSADAVIEAVNEEVRGDNAQYGMVSSGTAVIWLRRGSDLKPLPMAGSTGGAAKKPAAGPDTTTAAAPDAAPSAAPTASASANASSAPAKTAKPVSGKPPARQPPRPIGSPAPPPPPPTSN
jgi:hypothetical protein